MPRGSYSRRTGQIVQDALEAATEPADASLLIIELPYAAAWSMRDQPAAYRASLVALFERLLDEEMANIVAEYAPHPRVGAGGHPLG